MNNQASLKTPGRGVAESGIPLPQAGIFWQDAPIVINANNSIRTWHFALTIFLSAFLLFEVQPILGKYILPWFGGSSAVWTTCMLAYQALLLFGYLYAHALSKLPLKRQAVIHTSILAGSLLILLCRNSSWLTPILPGPNWKPLQESTPLSHILLILSASIGLPFVILSSTSALIQSWFARTNPGKAPYSFYMLSNIGSLLALLSYPFVIEPFFTLRTQALAWSGGYVLFLVMCSYNAIKLCTTAHGLTCQNTAKIQITTGAEAVPIAPPSIKTHAAWLFLSMFSSAMLLATTNKLTQDIAPVPLLWILPLSIYLFSFAVSFRQRATMSRDVWIPILLASTFTCCYTMDKIMDIYFIPIAASFIFVLLSCCMLSHKELYRLRPHPGHLTSFYLMIALGGAAGGVFVSVIAPLIFKAFWEFHFILMSYCVIAILILATKRQSWMKTLWIPGAMLSLAAILLLCRNFSSEERATIYMARNFYGTLSIHRDIVDNGNVYSLFHGQTVHGVQFASGHYHRKPVEYYYESSGVGLAFRLSPPRMAGQPLRAAGIGLGIGTIAAYGQTNDYFRFYEINPEVQKVALRTPYFTYMRDSPARLDVIQGDARISMEQERIKGQAQAFDIIVADAFNSDAIPVHLLTREAFELYLYHLAPDGIIAVHVSNAYLRLAPVVIATAEHLNMDYALIKTTGNGLATQISTWVLLTRNNKSLRHPAIAGVMSKKYKPGSATPMWTDDFSNLFSVMRW